MKVREFANELKESFQYFFGCDISSHINLDYDEFEVEARLNPKATWETEGSFILYTVKIYINENQTPTVKYIELPFVGEVMLEDCEDLSLEKAIIYIKEHLGTVKSKAIYDNL